MTTIIITIQGQHVEARCITGQSMSLPSSTHEELQMALKIREALVEVAKAKHGNKLKATIIQDDNAINRPPE